MNDATDRHIIHVDMDAFFAAVEQLDRPELRGKPVLVGGDPQGRGVVSTASYEARPYDCHSAMPMSQAVRLCPQATVVRPRMERYVEVSRQVFDIMGQFTPLVEPLSIDEAFLDVTGSTRLLGSPEQMAGQLKRRIREETQLTASAGVAPNKFLAKVASDLEKPDGLVVVHPGDIQAFLDPIPISRLWGVGKATLPQIDALGVRNFGDLRRFTEMQLRRRFGEAGGQYYRLVRGVDDREVVPDRQAKSISHEVTFPSDVDDHGHLRAVLLDQTEHVARRLRRHERLARTITIKVRTGDFKTVTRSATLVQATDQTEAIWQGVSELFNNWSRDPRPAQLRVRLIGVGISNLTSREGRQLELFDQDADPAGQHLDRAVDRIRDRFGHSAIGRAANVRHPEK